MGNRAVITNEDRKLGVYLHWNGGRNSVEGFLRYCELQGFRSPDDDPDYGWARLVQVCANFFDSGLSVGVFPYGSDEHANPGDNGVYVIEGWRIAEQIGAWQMEAVDEDVVTDLLLEIDRRMPATMRLGEEYLRGAFVDATELVRGDRVLLRDEAGVRALTVAGVLDTPHRTRSGREFPVGTPYADVMGEGAVDGPDLGNANNYLIGRIRIPG